MFLEPVLVLFWAVSEPVVMLLPTERTGFKWLSAWEGEFPGLTKSYSDIYQGVDQQNFFISIRGNYWGHKYHHCSSETMSLVFFTNILRSNSFLELRINLPGAEEAQLWRRRKECGRLSDRRVPASLSCRLSVSTLGFLLLTGLVGLYSFPNKEIDKHLVWATPASMKHYSPPSSVVSLHSFHSLSQHMSWL